jgi:proliferating cell nuclear antigen PCNA
MPLLFKAKTKEGYILKIVSDLLQNNIKTACIKIDKNGIYLTQMDNYRTILINLKLSSENFCIYKFKSEQKLILGLNLLHLYRMLKNIKKKDSVELFIDSENTSELGIKVIPKENNRVTTSFIKIQDIQLIEIDIPDGYSNSIIVSSSEFQKMAKDICSISDKVTVIPKKFQIRFKCDDNVVLKRYIDFGECEKSDDDNNEEGDDDVNSNSSEYKNLYNQNFKTETLYKICKISGLSDNLQIFTKKDLPILFKSYIGHLGKIFIYIKSIDQIETENKLEISNIV